MYLSKYIASYPRRPQYAYSTVLKVTPLYKVKTRHVTVGAEGLHKVIQFPNYSIHKRVRRNVRTNTFIWRELNMIFWGMSLIETEINQLPDKHTLLCVSSKRETTVESLLRFWAGLPSFPLLPLWLYIPHFYVYLL